MCHCKCDDARRATPAYAEMYKKAVRLAPTTPDIVERLVVTSKTDLVDLDEKKLNSHVETYTMGLDPSKCLIKYSINNPTGETTVKLSSYAILKNLRHHNNVIIENF